MHENLRPAEFATDCQLDASQSIKKMVCDRRTRLTNLRSTSKSKRGSPHDCAVAQADFSLPDGEGTSRDIAIVLGYRKSTVSDLLAEHRSELGLKDKLF